MDKPCHRRYCGTVPHLVASADLRDVIFATEKEMIPIPVPVTMDGLKQVSTWISGILGWKHSHDEAKKANIKAALESLMTAVR
jgi:hypothetical protein